VKVKRLRQVPKWAQRGVRLIDRESIDGTDPSFGKQLVRPRSRKARISDCSWDWKPPRVQRQGTAVGTLLDFSGERTPRITNRYNCVLPGFPTL